MNISKTIYYDASEVPTKVLEEIIQEIHKRGFGAAGPARLSSNLYSDIAAELAKRDNLPRPFTARLRCWYEKRNRLSVYSVPHCNPVDEILYKYFDSYSTGGEDYWYKKSTKLEDVIRWLNDDMRGTMENPF